MKMKLGLRLLICILVVSACGKQQTSFKIPESTAYNQMDLDNLEVGDKFYFENFLGNANGSYEPEDFEYLSTYLELEVLEKIGEGKYLMGEVLYHINSYVDDDGTVRYDYDFIRDDEMLTNVFHISDEYLRISGVDTLLPFRSYLYYNKELALEIFRDEEVDIVGWNTSFPYTEQDRRFYTTDLFLRGFSYDTLNVLMNNEGMQNDGPGFTTIYSRDYGIVRTNVYMLSYERGWGWDRIPYPFK